jgi:AraC family transcriptional regulator
MDPVFQSLPAFHVVGMCGWFEPETGPRRIPGLWDRFVPRLASLPPPVGGRTWGVCFGDRPADPSAPKTFFYMAALEVEGLGDIPPDMVGKTVPAARYAVFTHRGGLSGLHATIREVWGRWLPASGYRPAGTPDLELYDERFHPETGEIDLYVPILDPVTD